MSGDVVSLLASLSDEALQAMVDHGGIFTERVRRELDSRDSSARGAGSRDAAGAPPGTRPAAAYAGSPIPRLLVNETDGRILSTDREANEPDARHDNERGETL